MTGSPVLLVERDSLPASTLEAIRGLDPDDAVILGGPQAISDKVMNRIAAENLAFSRTSGPNRYATSAAIAQLGIDAGWLGAEHVGVASGESYADGLCGGVAMGYMRSPLILTSPSILSPEASAFLSDNSSTLLSARIFGGPRVLAYDIDTAVLDILD